MVLCNYKFFAIKKGVGMNSRLFNEIKFLAILIIPLANTPTINAGKIFITNRIPNMGFKIGVDGDEGCGYVRWDSSSLPGGKLTQAQGAAYEVINYCGKSGSLYDCPPKWKYIRLYVGKRNKVINIPTDFPCREWWYDKESNLPMCPGGCYPDYPVIIFRKNSADQVEVHRARINIAGGWSFIDDILVATLEPKDYE